jgi:hypothetical protein
MACKLADRAAGEALRRALLPYSGLHATGAYAVGIRGPVSYWLGRLDLLLDASDEAAVHFETAIREAEQARARSWVGWAELGLAWALSSSRNIENRRRADRARAAALRTAEQFGLPRLKRAARGEVEF